MLISGRLSVLGADLPTPQPCDLLTVKAAMVSSTIAESATGKQSFKTTIDVEKGGGVHPQTHESVDIEVGETQPVSRSRAWFSKGQALLGSGLELRGVSPVPLEERTVTRYSNVFSIWFCISVSLLP